MRLLSSHLTIVLSSSHLAIRRPHHRISKGKLIHILPVSSHSFPCGHPDSPLRFADSLRLRVALGPSRLKGKLPDAQGPRIGFSGPSNASCRLLFPRRRQSPPLLLFCILRLHDLDLGGGSLSRHRPNIGTDCSPSISSRRFVFRSWPACYKSTRRLVSPSLSGLPFTNSETS